MSLWFRSLTVMMQSPKLKHSPRLTLHHSLPWCNNQPIHNYEPVTGLTTAAACACVPWYPSCCVRHIFSNTRAVDMIGHKWVLGYLKKKKKKQPASCYQYLELCHSCFMSLTHDRLIQQRRWSGTLLSFTPAVFLIRFEYSCSHHDTDSLACPLSIQAKGQS